MELSLIVQSGDDAGRQIVVPAGQSLSFGRTTPSDIRFPADPMLSAQHFVIELQAEGIAILRDSGSRFGTLVNGLKVAQSELRDGDEIRAGRTSISVAFTGGSSTPRGNVTPDLEASQELSRTPPPVASLPVLPQDKRPLNPQQERIIQKLRSQTHTLFALLDAAREPSVVGRLERSQQEYQCLYEGQKGEELSAFGPWLVRLTPTAEILEDLVRDGWGHSWGVYLTTPLSLADLRRHLQKFLIVKLPDGRQVYFRFYDPRVLRTYLPTCTSSEIADFVGPIHRYIVEGADANDMLEFAGTFKEWRKIGT